MNIITLVQTIGLALCAAIGLIGGILSAGCSGSSGSETSKTCTFPTVLEQTPNGGDQLLLCGDGSILECSEGSCAFANGAATSGSPNSGNPDNSNQGNPVDSNNRTTNVNPTPTPRGLLGG